VLERRLGTCSGPNDPYLTALLASSWGVGSEIVNRFMVNHHTIGVYMTN
jgi:hypothetical protein